MGNIAKIAAGWSYVARSAIRKAFRNIAWTKKTSDSAVSVSQGT